MKNKEILILGILLALMLGGTYLRWYHINYPVLGYHNNKEVHYLSEARNFMREGFFRYGFFVPAIDYPALSDSPTGAHSDTFPTISILVGLAFMLIRSASVSAARMIGILFVIGTIPLMYLIVKKLFIREDMAVASAVITAILPLTVFFSHNVQLMNPGLFFLTLSFYLFLKWKDERIPRQLILSSFFFALAGITKYDYFIMGLLLLFIFPYKSFIKGKNKKITVLSCLMMLLIFPIWYFYSNDIVAVQYNTSRIANPEMVNYLQIFDASQWTTIEPYFADSWTMIGTYFALFGLLIAIYMFIKKREFGEGFLIALFVVSLFYFMVMFFKIKGHSYHMYPMVPFFIIAISYFIARISEVVKVLKVEGKPIPYLNIILIAILLTSMYFPMQDSWQRQFDTQFFGLDVAGEYIKENKIEGERVMHSSHQAYGVLWHGDIKGTRGIPSTVEEMKFAEEKLNATWIFIYNWDFKRVMENTELWSYISNNYGLKQVGFFRLKETEFQLVYMLFKKGGTFDGNLNLFIQGKPMGQKDYELSSGIVRLYIL